MTTRDPNRVLLYERRLTQIVGRRFKSFALARSCQGFEKPSAALHLLHKFDELYLTSLAGFQILNQDNVTEFL